MGACPGRMAAARRPRSRPRPREPDYDEFHWRVSMARVARNGPFSSFEGVDPDPSDPGRWRPSAGHRRPGAMELTASSSPLSFPAKLPATAALADGPVVDLNVMTRRGAVEHAVDRLAVAGRREVRVEGARGCCSAGPGSVEVAIGAEEATLRSRRFRAGRALPGRTMGATGATFGQGVPDPAPPRASSSPG